MFVFVFFEIRHSLDQEGDDESQGRCRLGIDIVSRRYLVVYVLHTLL